MSYDSKEKSVAEGRPIELYDWTASSRHWRMNSGTRRLEYLGQYFDPEVMTRTDYEISSSFADTPTFEVTLPDSNSFAKLWSLYPIDAEVSLKVYRGHDEADYIPYFSGIVESVRYRGDKAFVTVLSRVVKLQRQGGSSRFQRLCPLTLYRTRCGVAKNAHRVTGSVVTISGNTVSSGVFASYPNSWFLGGWIEVNGYARMIIGHTGAVISYTHPIPGIVSGMTYYAYPGCSHLITECRDKFDNMRAYGGHRFLPEKCPVSGDPIA